MATSAGWGDHSMSLPTTMIFFSFTNPAPTAGEVLAQPQSVANGPGNSYTFQVPNVGGMATKTVSYVAQLSDCGMLILFNSASAISYTLLNPPPSLPQGAKWRVEVENIGAGVLTINPNGLNLDGSASSITLNQNQGCTISTDGSNYGSQRGIGGGGGGTPGGSNTQVQYNASGVFGGISGAISDGTSLFVTTQAAGDNSTKAASTAYVDTVNRPQFPVSSIIGRPTGGQLVMIYTAPCALFFPANFTGPNSVVSFSAAPTASAVYSFYKNGVLVGTLTLAATTGAATWATVGGVSFSLNALDRMTAYAPGSSDATLADVSFTLIANLSASVAPGTVPPIFTWRGGYSGGTTYQPFDVVAFHDSSYVCILTTTGHDPANGTYWTLLAAGFNFLGAYAGGTSYVPNDVVTYNGSTYLCILASTGNLPTNATYWSVLAQKGMDGAPGGVTGPGSATDSDFAQFDGATGAVIKDGGLSRSTDGTFAANSDVLIPSQKAIKTYVASAGGGDLTAKYLIGATAADLTNARIWPGLYNHPDAPPPSPGSLDDEFDAGSLAGSWSWVNQGSASVSFAKSYLNLKTTSDSSNNYLRILVKTAPSTPWTVTTKMWINTPSSNALMFGLAVRESSTGKLVVFYVRPYSSNGLAVTTFSDPNTAASDLSIGGPYVFGVTAPVYLRITDNGTNLLFSWAINGVTFTQFYSVSRTGYLASGPNQVGLFVCDRLVGTGGLTLSADYDFFRSS
jgi:hypothetical protein